MCVEVSLFYVFYVSVLWICKKTIKIRSHDHSLSYNEYIVESVIYTLEALKPLPYRN